ncbi:unnamed protein product [Linum tenue]|uniref:Pentatricopeptide repeat-containing protein n=1 Tax=Linum tenue TaxID=586396 RepID=A0AAV0L635_9ROSI|nr:unnamed protein product [Linum tenue]
MFSRLLKDNSLRPSTHTYSVTIGGLCRQGLVDEAYDLFRKMELDGCLPDSFCYNRIIHGFLHDKDPHEAVALIQEMVSKGFSADTTTMSLLIQVLPKNQLNHPLVQKLLNGPDINIQEIES